MEENSVSNSNLQSLVIPTANFIYSYTQHKTTNHDDKRACKEFVDLLNEAFNEEKAIDYLKSVIYDRLSSDKANLKKGDGGKSYRNMYNYFEGKPNSKFFFPTRDKLIQICFDFDISNREEINALFDKMYCERLYLKEGRDFVTYCCLTKPKIKAEMEALYPCEKKYLDCIDDFIKDENINLKRSLIKKGFDGGASKYTSEIYEEIEDWVESVDDIKLYYRENMPIFLQQRQYTVKTYLSKMSKLADKGLLEEIFFSDFDNSDDNQSSLYKKLWASFSTYCKGGKGGNDVSTSYVSLIPGIFDTKNSNDPFEPIDTESTAFDRPIIDKLEHIDYLMPRGTFLLMYLFFLATEAEERGLEEIDWVTKLNVRLDDAGFALFNEDGVLIDKIVSLYIQAFGFYTETIEDILQFITFVSRLEDDCPFDD